LRSTTKLKRVMDALRKKGVGCIVGRLGLDLGGGDKLLSLILAIILMVFGRKNGSEPYENSNI
jgi:hypothetical protein